MDFTFVDIRMGRSLIEHESYVSYGVVIDEEYQPRYFTIPDYELEELMISSEEELARYLYRKEFETYSIITEGGLN